MIERPFYFMTAQPRGGGGSTDALVFFPFTGRDGRGRFHSGYCVNSRNFVFFMPHPDQD